MLYMYLCTYVCIYLYIHIQTVDICFKTTTYVMLFMLATSRIIIHHNSSFSDFSSCLTNTTITTEEICAMGVNGYESD